MTWSALYGGTDGDTVAGSFMHHRELDILYEDNHLLVVNKPAGIATMGLPDGEETLLTVAKDYVRERYAKPGKVYLGVVSRLDVPVSGVVVFARTSKAAVRLNDQFRDHTVEKIYHAIVEGIISPKEALLVNHLCEDERHRKMRVSVRPTAESKEARLRYKCLKSGFRLQASGFRKEIQTSLLKSKTRTPNCSLLEVTLETGRKHQIRLQLSHKGNPILGDRKYGAKMPFPQGIALHAKRLVITHPVTKEQLVFEAQLPQVWW